MDQQVGFFFIFNNIQLLLVGVNGVVWKKYILNILILLFVVASAVHAIYMYNKLLLIYCFIMASDG